MNSSASSPPPLKVLVLLGSPFLYGQERAVIEMFDKLRPEVQPHLILTYTAFRKQLPILKEVESRHLDHSFLPDKREWPRIGKPRSLREAWGLCVSLVRGNLCALKAARGQDALYVASLLGAFHSVPAALYLRARGKRVIHHFHDYLGKPSGILKWWTALVTDFIHNSDTACRAATASNPYISKRRNVVIPYLLDLPLVGRPPEPEPSGAREIFFVGQVSPHKGIDLLLEAFRQLRGCNARLNIVGSPPPHFRKAFDALLQRSNPDCNVRFLGYQSNVMQLLASAYLYVHPSPPSRFHESYGRGVVEAMSLGVPSVCFRSGTLAEIVVNEETGLICEEENPEAIAAAIKRFLGDPKFRDQCGRNARIRYEQRYGSAVTRPLWLRFWRGGFAERLAKQ